MSRRELGSVRGAGTTVTVYALDELGALQLVLTGSRASAAAVLGANAAVSLAGILTAWGGVDIWNGGDREGPRSGDDMDDEPPGSSGPTREQEEGWDAREDLGHDPADWPSTYGDGHVAGQLPLPQPAPGTLADRLHESARLLWVQGGERSMAAGMVEAAANRLRGIQ